MREMSTFKFAWLQICGCVGKLKTCHFRTESITFFLSLLLSLFPEVKQNYRSHITPKSINTVELIIIITIPLNTSQKISLINY